MLRVGFLGFEWFTSPRGAAGFLRGGALGLLMLLPLGWFGMARVSAQTAHDLLNYSVYDPVMTARSVSMGSTMGAVGADVSCMSMNPGAMGLYRTWDLHFSMSLSSLSSRGVELNSGTTTRRWGLMGDFNSFGFVMKFPKGRMWDSTRTVKGFVVSIGYNKLRDFSRSSLLRAETTGNTFLDALADFGNRVGAVPEQLEAQDAYERFDPYLVNAWQGFALDTIQDPSALPNFAGFSAPFLAGARVLEEHSLRASGGLHELGFNFAINLKERLFIGGTLGVDVLNHKWVTTHRFELRDDPRSNAFDRGTIKVTNRDYGLGVNFKAGVVGCLGDYVRLGLAVHTPTLLAVESSQEMEVKSHIFGHQAPDKEADSKSQFNYSFVAPMRVIASVSGIIGKRAILNADYHLSLSPFTYFSEFRGNSDGKAVDLLSTDEFAEDNAFIRDQTQLTHQANLGAEVLLGIVALRAGGGISTSPYRSKEFQKLIPFQYYVGGGLGISFTRWLYMDLGCRYTHRDYEYALYNFGNPALSSYAKTSNTTLHFMLGLGFRL